MSAPHTPVERADFDQVIVPTFAPAAFVPVRGLGSRVWDQSGRELVDFAGGIAVNALGHAHPALVAALTEQAGKLWHISNIYTNEPALRLAKKLVAATFADRAFFCNSGAEANEAAFKLARRYAHDVYGPQKFEIISALNSFHGRTLFTVTVGGQSKYSDGFGPKIEGISHVPYNDLEALKAAISDKTCAVVLEPIQGESGILPGEQAYLEGARQLCNEHNALLIFDEVQTGMGRTGTLWGIEHWDCPPDIMAMGKALGGAVIPVGNFMATPEVFEAMFENPYIHTTTFGGNPMATAAIISALHATLEEDIPGQAATKGAWLKERFAEMQKRYPDVLEDVRGLGLLIGLEFVTPEFGYAMSTGLFGEGVLVGGTLFNAKTFRIEPPATLTQEQMDQIVERVERVLVATREKHLKGELTELH